MGPFELLSAYLDGRPLSEQEAREVCQWVKASPENARVVVELGIIHSQVDYFALADLRAIEGLDEPNQAELHRRLESALESFAFDSPEGVSPRPRLSPTSNRQPRTGAKWWLLASAGLAASALLSLLVPSKPPEQRVDSSDPALVAKQEQALPAVGVRSVVATVTEVIGDETSAAALHRRGGQIWRGEEINVSAGLLALTTTDGSEIVVEGPAKFVFEQVDQITLTTGRLAARVDGKVADLTVKTPTAVVVDLGTEFGVGVGEDLRTYVAVYEGAVQLYSGVERPAENAAPRPKRVTAGRAGQVDADGQVHWAVQTLPSEREFVRPDEVASLREALGGSAEARQRTCFYAMQRTTGLLAFQSFDIPSRGASYSLAFLGASPRMESKPEFGDDLCPKQLYSSGALRIAEGEDAYLDIDTTNDSPLARAGLIDDRGRIGRSGSELWLAWSTQADYPEKIGDHAGLSLMFGDARLTQEPLFVGHTGGKALLSMLSNLGSKTVEVELDADPETFAIESIEVGDRVHHWVMRLIFGERSDSVAVWCDVPLEAIRATRPHAEAVNANVIFDRLRIGVSPAASAWHFDDVVMATTIDALSKVQSIHGDFAIPETGSGRKTPPRLQDGQPDAFR